MEMAQRSQTVQAGGCPEQPGNEPRIINYLGGKHRFIDEIRRSLRTVSPSGERVLDMFSGTGAVGAGVMDEWEVTAADIQEYSRVLCNAELNGPLQNSSKLRPLLQQAIDSPLAARLSLALRPLLELEEKALVSAAAGKSDLMADLLESGPLAFPTDYSVAAPQVREARKLSKRRLGDAGLADGPDTVVSRFYAGPYFSWKQAIALDSVLGLAHELDGADKDTLLAACFGAAGDAVTSIGKHFAQPIRLRDSGSKIKSRNVPQVIRDRTVDILESVKHRFRILEKRSRRDVRHNAVCADYRDVLGDASLHFDVVYADPPYTRDHYSRFYHILETMARRDEPILSTTSIRSKGEARPSRGVYRNDRHQSPFSIKSQAPAAFDELARGVRARGVPLVLSYSPFASETGGRPRLVGVSDLVDIMGNHFSEVVAQSVAGSVHSKLNRTGVHAEVNHDAEVLIRCRP